MQPRARLFFVLTAASLGGAAITMPEPAEAAKAAVRPAVEFHCTLTGSAKGSPGLTRAAVCARFAAALEPALKVRLIPVSAAPAPGKGRWISIQVKLGAPARAEADFTSRLGRTVKKHPSIGIDVMDKRLEMREIDLLAKDVAEVLRTAR